ncbi:MAG TPA: XRE family transcriptional regulator [Vicinamibacterales bacterium]|nr:XRE family transcriptional regulator [Vicinamibacterales bacterium]
MTTKIRRSSGNVFRDLGFSAEEATNLKIRSDLMIRLSKLIETRGLTQAQAADLFGVTQPRISDLVRGKIDRFSIDTLIAMLGHAGVRVQIVLGRSTKVVNGLPLSRERRSRTARFSAMRPRRLSAAAAR